MYPNTTPTVVGVAIETIPPITGVHDTVPLLLTTNTFPSVPIGKNVVVPVLD